MNFLLVMCVADNCSHFNTCNSAFNNDDFGEPFKNFEDILNLMWSFIYGQCFVFQSLPIPK